MNLTEMARRGIAWLIIERPASWRTFDELAFLLERSQKKLATRFANAKDSPEARDKLRHIIGIERWGQRRVRVALGEELVRDEYHAYKPSEDADWQALQQAFQETREESIALTRELENEHVQPDQRIPHNYFGPLTLRGWLRYLRTHADVEARSIR